MWNRLCFSPLFSCGVAGLCRLQSLLEVQQAIWRAAEPGPEPEYFLAPLKGIILAVIFCETFESLLNRLPRVEVDCTPLSTLDGDVSRGAPNLSVEVQPACGKWAFSGFFDDLAIQTGYSASSAVLCSLDTFLFFCAFAFLVFCKGNVDALGQWRVKYLRSVYEHCLILLHTSC